MAKISIIVPVYNVEKYLPECLDSIINQDFEDWEAICVNDGSTDKSLEILEKYAEKETRIRVISQQNRGLAGARNIGIELAMGKYICFLDSDDILKEFALSTLYSVSCESNYNFIVYNTDIFYETKELENKFYKTDYYLKKHKYFGEYKGTDLLCKMINNREYCDSAWLFFINLKWLKENNIYFYEGILYEDVLFSTICYLRATHIKYIDETIYSYRVRTNSIMTSKMRYKNLYSYLVCYKELFLEIINGEYDDNTTINISKYLNQIIANIICIYDMLSDGEKEEYRYLLPKDKIVADALNVSPNRSEISTKIYMKGFLDTLVNEEKIILYGAGKVGKITLDFLKKQGLNDKVIGFAVSDKQFEKFKYGVKVYNINDLKTCKNALILITTGKNYHNEIKKILKDLSFNKYETIDYILESNMKKYIEENNDL